MANNIKIDLTLTGEQPTARGLKNVGDAADRAGDDLQGMAKDAGFLDKKIGELQGGIREMIREFDRTGDIDLLKKIKADSRQLGQFDGLKKKLTDVAVELGQEGVKVGASVGVKMGGSVMESAATTLAGSKALLIGGIATLVAASAPFLGASIASIVVGGVGAGGIAGGIALAAQDSRVQGEAEKLGEHIKNSFARAGDPFIAPTIEALKLLRGVVDDVSDDLTQSFKSLAPVFMPLARGITGLVQEAMPGFQKALEAAKPVIRAIANELPDIGEAISDFFSEIADEKDGAIQGFVALSKIIQSMIRGTGQFIGALSSAFEHTVRFALKIAPVMEAIWGWIPGLGDNIKTQRKRMEELVAGFNAANDASGDFAGNLDDIADSAADAEKEIIALQAAMDEAFGKTMDIQKATMAYEESWDNAIEALKEGKRTLDSTTEAGRENRGAILDNIQAIKDLRDTNIENGMSVADANALYDTQIEKLRQFAIKAGFSKTELDGLINAFDRLPKDVELELRVKGLKGVIEQVYALSSLLGSKAAASASIRGEYISGRASGGPVYPGQTYVVGEEGPEVLQMGGAGGHVYNAQQTAAMMSGASGGGSMAVGIVVSPKPGAESAFLAWLITQLQFEVQTTGEGSADRFFAGSRF